MSATDFFANEVHPILKDNCFECHSHAAGQSKGGLVVDSRKGLLVGGDLGSAITVGDSQKSLLIQAVTHTHADLRMPKDGAPLSSGQIATLKKWIEDGAIWPGSEKGTPEVLTDEERRDGHWAYQPLSNPAVPEIQEAAWKVWVRNPIDHFIADKLEGVDIEPGRPASSDVFLRRLSYGLTGLPPRWGESPEGAVERLLSSREYGRKWGRHWLDVVRYADTAGDNADYPIPEMSLFRDYVVDAFNEDLPFDEFIKEQIAGDLMDSGENAALRRRRVIATSFVAGSMRFCDDLKKDLPLVIDETVDAVGQAFMGMTLSCAKCHNHKTEPIPMKDYYALYGIFSSTRFPYAGREGRQIPVNFVPTGLDREANERIREINDHIRHDLLTKGRLKIHTERGQALISLLNEQRALSELVFGVRDRREVGDARIHLRGNAKKKGREVKRGFFSVITPDAQARIPSGKSGRLQLAEWIASPNHPLTARVIVNRIWAWHFGKGLVPTTNNFGISGESPTHPDLLDYLARRFIESGWSLKELHRLILNSATYRQEWRSEAYSLDSSNTLYWRFDRRRLTAEELRDSALMAAGLLDFETPGRHPFPFFGDHHFTQHKPFKANFTHNHRSIYLMTSRIRRQEFASLFDGADPTRSTGMRRTSTIPQQALYLLNSERFDEFSRHFAARLGDEFSTSRERIIAAYRICYFREPRPAEIVRLEKFLLRQPEENAGQSPWEIIAQTMLLSNEFNYLD